MPFPLRLSLLLLLVSACIPQTPIPIYVTPTHETTTTPIPTVGGLAPTETPQDAVSAAVVEESPVATVERPPTRPGVRPGPVIGSDYTPPPTFTPRSCALGYTATYTRGDRPTDICP